MQTSSNLNFGTRAPFYVGREAEKGDKALAKKVTTAYKNVQTSLKAQPEKDKFSAIVHGFNSAAETALMQFEYTPVGSKKRTVSPSKFIDLNEGTDAFKKNIMDIYKNMKGE